MNDGCSEEDIDGSPLRTDLDRLCDELHAPVRAQIAVDSAYRDNKYGRELYDRIYHDRDERLRTWSAADHAYVINDTDEAAPF